MCIAEISIVVNGTLFSWRARCLGKLRYVRKEHMGHLEDEGDPRHVFATNAELDNTVYNERGRNELRRAAVQLHDADQEKHRQANVHQMTERR